MANPDVTFQIQDGALGQVPANTANTQLKTGVCSAGTVGTIYSANDNATAAAALGQGPLVDAGAQTLSVAGGPVYFLPINPSSAGSTNVGPAHTGPGAGTVTSTLAPAQAVLLKITTGGTLTTMQVAISLNGGATYGTPTVSGGGPWTLPIPGTLSSAIFAAATYTLNDVYTIATDGTVTVAGTGPAGNVTHTDSPLDAYSVVVTMSGAGALGVATFKVSVDGGDNYSGDILVPAAGKYAIPSTGVVLTFASTFTAGDTYSFSTTTAGFSNSDVTTACTTAFASPLEFSWIHLVGAGANAAAAVATAAVLDTQMTAALAAYRFIFAVMECPTSESDATVAAAFASFSSVRVAACAGDCELVSPLNGRIMRRNIAWAYTARLAGIDPGTSPAAVKLGKVPNVFSLYRDNSASSLLGDSRFVTMRTLRGKQGYFFTRGVMMAPSGSDFSSVMNRRVMDLACRITRAALLPYLNTDVRIDPKTGYIDERDAQIIEANVNAQLSAGVVANGNASSSSVVLSRTSNILATSSEPVTVRIVPKGYLENIAVNIGFSNPALVA
jgi:hypothetical protein